ncbi:MAG: transglutaminase domain-containing protein [Promethearchaeota archaeon]
MSELREELLAPKHLRKQIMGVVIIAGLLIAAFAFSTALISLIFDTQRLAPNNKLADAEDEKALLMLPPFPFNESFLEDLFSDLNLTQEELEDLIDMLSEMFDGGIDDLDLGIYGAGILALLLSDEEVFRVYDYSTFSNMSDILWRYECFDEYTGDSWKSSASKDVYPFYSYGDHDSLYPNLDILLLKMFLSPNYGMNSLVIPSLFPTPFIMEGSVTAPSLDTSLTVLYKDDFDCTTLDVYFSESNEVGMKYQLFGLELPSGEEINSTAKDENYTPTNIKNLFLQLPPSIEDYKNNNNYFKHHYDILNGIIEDSDNAFIVANKIRTYLQDNFNFPADADSYNPAPEGRDTVDWFCETEQGVFSDFASAFCVFTRAFGVASRFIDGFNSQSIEQFNDVDEGDKSAFAIKYKNIYNWGEIYVPTDVSGDGDWVQMDILYERYGEGNAWSTDEYNITVSSNFTEGYRGQVANITATLNSTTGSIEGQSITFTDITTGQTLGIASTNAHGNASILVNIDHTQVVGPHDISAEYNPQTEAYTNYTIFGDIRVNLQSINPSEVNISKTPPDTTNIQGFVDDPINGQRVKNALISILLFKKGTNDMIDGAFSPGSTVTDSNGNFNEILTVNAPAGIYEVRADFNGTWAGWSKTYYNINDSSNRIQFNVTEELTYNLFFCINGTPTNYPLAPNFGNLLFAKRGEQLNISVNVTSVDYGYPVKDITVQFYDYTNGDVLIGSDITNSEGNASIIYNLGSSNKTGPTLLYVKAGNKRNYTYYILNETIEFNYISGPDPPEINRTGSGSIFNILTFLEDSQTNPINFTQITLKMFKDSIDYSGYLDPSNIYYDIGGSNLFNINMGVKPDTPLENYTLRLDFNGTFDYSNDINNQYQASFDVPDLNCSLVLPMDLCVEDYNYFVFNFFINGTTSDNYTYPRIDRNGHLNLTVNLQWGGHLIENGEWVSFYDVTNDTCVGDAQIYDGIANFTYITTMNTVAGPHLIYANYSKGGSMEYNYSYFILDAPINISLDKCPSPNTINRSDTLDTQFMVHGFLIDGENKNLVKFGRIRVLLFEGIIDRTNFLIGVEGTQQHGTYFYCNKTGEFLMYFQVNDLTPQKNYTLRVDFNGTFYYNNKTDDLYLEKFSNQHVFNQIDSISSNFSFSAGGLHELKVKDPEDVLIIFKRSRGCSNHL